jgi:hypothetical protein
MHLAIFYFFLQYSMCIFNSIIWTYLILNLQFLQHICQHFLHSSIWNFFTYLGVVYTYYPIDKLLQAPAKLEIEVTNLAAKAGKGICWMPYLEKRHIWFGCPVQWGFVYSKFIGDLICTFFNQTSHVIFLVMISYHKLFPHWSFFAT